MKFKLQEFIKNKYLFSIDDKLLVAVSGGIDSVVLCYLLHSCPYHFSIAHCNFQLRGHESDEDEAFVKALAKDLGVACHSKRFDTEGVVSEKKISTQLAARELRYQWFDELRQIHGYQYIITAHHASDNIETVLYNFTKGTGLRGITGMKPKNNAIVRPLLWAKKEEIIAFAQAQNWTYREDASNESDKYSRNYIRHHTIPSLQHINSSFETTAIANIKRLDETQVLLDFFLENVKPQIIKPIENQFFINKKKLKTYPSVQTLLFELIKEFGFNTAQVEQILKNDVHRTGAIYYSQTHKLLIDRDYYIVAKQNIENKNNVFYSIWQDDTYIRNDCFELFFHYFEDIPQSFSQNSQIALFQYEKLTFPLILRKWQAGDRFQPLGMGGKSQLLSDFFRLTKLSQFEKEAVWVLETAQKEICWVVGYRIDERFKLTEKVKTCLRLEIKKD